MNRGITLGIVGGAIVGGASAVAIERATHDRPAAAPPGLDAWTEAFNDHFRTDQSADEARNERSAAAYAAWVEEHPAPDGMSATRVDETWHVENEPTGGRGSTSWLVLVGLMGGMTSMMPWMLLDRPGTDVRRLVGWKGVAAAAPMAAVAAFIGGFVASDLSH